MTVDCLNETTLDFCFTVFCQQTSASVLIPVSLFGGGVNFLHLPRHWEINKIFYLCVCARCDCTSNGGRLAGRKGSEWSVVKTTWPPKGHKWTIDDKRQQQDNNQLISLQKRNTEEDWLGRRRVEERLFSEAQKERTQAEKADEILCMEVWKKGRAPCVGAFYLCVDRDER